MFSHLVIILNSQHIEDIISHFLHLPLELFKLKKKKKVKKKIRRIDIVERVEL